MKFLSHLPFIFLSFVSLLLLIVMFIIITRYPTALLLINLPNKLSKINSTQQRIKYLTFPIWVLLSCCPFGVSLWLAYFYGFFGSLPSTIYLVDISYHMLKPKVIWYWDCHVWRFPKSSFHVLFVLVRKYYLLSLK